MSDYSLILTTNYAGKEWSLNANDYSSLQWFSNTSKPTQSELDDLWETTQATIVAKKAQKETDAQTAKDAKASALAKLAALGLTQDEVKALIG